MIYNAAYSPIGYFENISEGDLLKAARVNVEAPLLLTKLLSDKMLERKALEAENLNKSLQYRPLGHNWNVI